MPKTLLVADDSATIQKVVMLTFADDDLIVEAAFDGNQAVEKARTIKPDLILADVSMPGPNGYQVCETIRNDPQLAKTPVILLVGTFEHFNEKEAARVQCDGYLTKPFDTSELIETVYSLAGLRQGKPAAQAKKGNTKTSVKPHTPPCKELVSSRTRESFLGSNRILDLFDTEQEAPAETEAPVRADVKDAASSQVIPFPGVRETSGGSGATVISEEMLDAIAKRVVRSMTPDIVREVVWEVVPELAEILIRQCLTERGVVGKN